MKKLLVLTAVACAATGMALNSFAATYTKSERGVVQTIQGSLTSINQDNKTIVVKDNDDGKEYVIGVPSDEFSTLIQGQNIKVTLMQGSNMATFVTK